LIDESYTPFYIEFTTGSVDVSSIYPTESVIYSSEGNYYFAFTPQHEVDTDYVITIQIPTELNVQ